MEEVIDVGEYSIQCTHNNRDQGVIVCFCSILVKFNKSTVKSHSKQ